MSISYFFVKTFAFTNLLLSSSRVSADDTYDAFQIPKCYDKDSLITPQDPLFAKHRLAFSKFYENWPYSIVEPVPSSFSNFIPADDAAMTKGKEAISQIIQCSNASNIKFTARSGGHNNAGASVMNGLLTIDTRGMNRISAIANTQPKDISPKQRSYWSPGNVSVGVGATAGQSLYVSFNQTSGQVGNAAINFAGALPVGQKPSVGMAGLTLGGGFGFMTRFGGFLCDRLISFEAVIPSGPSAGMKIEVTKNGPYEDLFWAACGGGGGNFVVVTDFKFDLMPVCPYNPPPTNDAVSPVKCTGVVKVEYPVMLDDTDAIDFYQHMSYDIDTRITLNFEVNNTHGMVTGIFLGPWDAFMNSLKTAGVNEATPLTLSGFEQNSKIVKNFAQAITDLTGWTNEDNSPNILIQSFLQERSYFKYKSFFLFEPVNAEVIKMLQDLVTYDDKNNSLVFEFQSLGGGPGTDIADYDPRNIYQSPPNNFSSVDPKATAFPHRNARHCLMLKATGNTTMEAEDLLQKMEYSFFKLAKKIKGGASYYNHMDLSVPGIDLYFKNGVEKSDQDYWVDKLASVRRKYNGDGMLSNLRPCCDKPKDPKDPKPPTSGGDIKFSFRNIFYFTIVLSVCEWF